MAPPPTMLDLDPELPPSLGLGPGRVQPVQPRQPPQVRQCSQPQPNLDLVPGQLRPVRPQLRLDLDLQPGQDKPVQPWQPARGQWCNRPPQEQQCSQLWPPLPPRAAHRQRRLLQQEGRVSGARACPSRSRCRLETQPTLPLLTHDTSSSSHTARQARLRHCPMPHRACPSPGR